MTDEIKHYGDPIEFCGDQEGWIAVASLTDESPNSPCHPRVVLLGVGLGPSGKMHPSNIAAMLTVEQATDLRERLTAATAVDRPATTPTPAPGLDLDAVERAERAMTPGPWRHGSVERHHVFCSEGDRSLLCPEAGRVLLRMNEHFPHDSDAAGIVALRNAASALIAEVRALRAAAEEREADMHMRIRAGYDKTVADAEIADLRALVESQRHADLTAPARLVEVSP